MKLAGLRSWLNQEKTLGVLIVLFPIAFALWGSFYLTESPGFSMDEAVVVAPALNFYHHGYLATEQAGPGWGREYSFFSQTPLHQILLAEFFKLVGAGLWQGRLLSLMLAVVVLILVCLAMRPLGRAASLLAMVVLSVDPLFTSCARLMPKEWLALIGMLAAFILLREVWCFPGPAEQQVKPFRCLAAGLLVGMAVNSHVLALIYVFSFALLLLLYPWGRKIWDWHRLYRVALFLAAFLLAMVPFALYVWRYPVEFEQQFLWMVKFHTAEPTVSRSWILAEVGKYWQCYRWTPAWLGLMVVALGYSLVAGKETLQSRNQEAAAPHRVLFQVILILTILIPLLVAGVSKPVPWHHLFAVPVWSMFVSAALVHSRARPKFRVWFTVLASLYFLAVGNGLLVNWGYRSYSAWAGRGSRFSLEMMDQVKAIVPRDSVVYGPYYLVFLADQENWKFIFNVPYLMADRDAIAHIPFDYLLFADSEEIDRQLFPDPRLPDYKFLAEVKAPAPAPILKNLNPYYIPLDLKIFIRKSKLPR
jgi:4-amino-4-deoxy-L-arabinose transferase-like glycosyltransferase